MKKAKENSVRKFTPGDFVVYPAHGVGEVKSFEQFTIDNATMSVIKVAFNKERMEIFLPVEQSIQQGLRHLSSRRSMDLALETLASTRIRVKRAMWSRRAQEYESKIHSGNPIQIAEVVRELYRSGEQPDPSYSERQIYQRAFERLVREIAAIEKIGQEEASQKIEGMLQQSAA